MTLQEMVGKYAKSHATTTCTDLYRTWFSSQKKGGYYVNINHRLNRRQMLVFLVTLIVFLLLHVSGTMAATKVSLLHGWTGFRDPMVNEMIDGFNKAYPGIVAEPRLVPNSELNQHFMVAYAGGIAPDVVMISTANLVALADEGVLLCIDEFMQRDGLTADMWFPSELAMGQHAGKQYGLPIRTGGEQGNILYYNKIMFETAGLDSSRAPATWDELYAYSKKLIRYDGNQIVVNPINDLTQASSNQAVINWLLAGGASYLSNDLRKVEFASDAAVNMVDWVYTFRSQVYKAVGDDLLKNEDFYNGRSAMFIWGSEGFSYVWDQNPQFPLGAGPRPKHPSSSYIGANTGTWSYAIPATVANKEAAWELLKWLTIREESAGWFIRAQGRPSPIVKYNRHPEYLKVNPLMPIVGDVLAQVAQVTILPVQNDIVKPFKNAFAAAVKGQVASRSALEDAAAQAQAVLDKYWADRDKK